MIIRKVLNNNAVLAVDENKNESLVLGKGIAFKKTTGDWLPTDDNQQLFTLKDKEINSKFQKLLNAINLESIETADEIIKYAKANLGKRLNENIYITLSDHIDSSIKRYQEGITLRNALLPDIKRFYKVEYNISLEALDIIEKKLGVRLPADEAGFIAFHFVNAEIDGKIENVKKITEIMHEVVNIVKYFFKVSFEEEDIYYERFVTHLKFFAQRIVVNQKYGDEEDELLMIIKEKYKNAYSCTEKINHFIENKYQYVLPTEERVYLTIHIHRLIYKSTAVNK